MVGNSAIKGFTRPQDATAPTTGYVIGLVLLASGFTFTGLSFMDPFFGRPPPSWRVIRETGYAELVTPPRELFYHDLPAEEAEFWVSQLTPQMPPTVRASIHSGANRGIHRRLRVRGCDKSTAYRANLSMINTSLPWQPM
ncbi:hypothetical protein BDV29DRAFT_186545, partial [Aspergillus leporis]